MPAGDLAQAADGAAIHLGEPAGLADAAPLGDVLQDRFDLRGRRARVERGRALTPGEAGLAGPAAEHATRLVGAVAAGHGQVSGPPLAVLGAAGIRAAEAGQVVRGAAPPVRSPRPDGEYVIPSGYTNGDGECNRVRPPGDRVGRMKSPRGIRARLPWAASRNARGFFEPAQRESRMPITCVSRMSLRYRASVSGLLLLRRSCWTKNGFAFAMASASTASRSSAVRPTR